MTKPLIIRDLAELTAQVNAWRQAGETIGVVPTMGALHEGHLSLARRARAENDRVVVTIFVNPTQFNNPEDLAKYPRTEEADAVAIAPIGVDVIFAPSPDQIYPAGFATSVSVGGLTNVLEGEHRPGHFDGVATVVSKLFGMTQADRAYFGQKDWQQLQVVRRLVADLNMAIEIVACETVREESGLAMASRNLRLDPASRALAPALHRIMQEAAAAVRDGGAVSAVMEKAQADLLAAGFTSIDYLELRDAASLQPVADLSAGPARMLAAATIGGIRLIDNIAV